VLEAKPADEAVSEVKPTIEPKPTAEAKPARPALAVVRAPEPKPAVIAEPAPAAPVVEARPAAVPASEAIAAPLPKRPQSVEAMFAEAFAHDRLTVSPEPEETASATPGSGKSPV
jgi:hypothetical protein